MLHLFLKKIVRCHNEWAFKKKILDSIFMPSTVYAKGGINGLYEALYKKVEKDAQSVFWDDLTSLSF